MTAAILERGNLASPIPEDDNRLIQKRARERLPCDFFRGGCHVPSIANEHARPLFSRLSSTHSGSRSWSNFKSAALANIYSIWNKYSSPGFRVVRISIG